MAINMDGRKAMRELMDKDPERFRQAAAHIKAAIRLYEGTDRCRLMAAINHAWGRTHVLFPETALQGDKVPQAGLKPVAN